MRGAGQHPFFCMYRTTLEYYPNNEIRVSCRLAPAAPKDEWYSGYEDMALPVEPYGPHPLVIREELETEGCPSDELKPGFGGLPRKTRFGLNAKRGLLRAGGAVDKLIKSPNEVIFLTGTLPGSTPEAIQTLARYSSFAIHRLKAWINKYIPQKKDFYVWELQRRGALHLHYAVVCPQQPIRARIIAGFASQWGRILASISEQSGVDVFARADGGSWRDRPDKWRFDAQEVRRSVAGYLSKYCGKDSGKTADGVKAYAPTRWWGVSRPLLEFCRELSGKVYIEFRHYKEAEFLFKKITRLLSGTAAKFWQYREKQMDGVVSVSYTQKGFWNDVVSEAERIMSPRTERERRNLIMDYEMQKNTHVKLARMLFEQDERGHMITDLRGYSWDRERIRFFHLMAYSHKNWSQLKEEDKGSFVAYVNEWARAYIRWGLKNELCRKIRALAVGPTLLSRYVNEEWARRDWKKGIEPYEEGVTQLHFNL